MTHKSFLECFWFAGKGLLIVAAVVGAPWLVGTTFRLLLEHVLGPLLDWIGEHTNWWFQLSLTIVGGILGVWLVVALIICMAMDGSK